MALVGSAAASAVTGRDLLTAAPLTLAVLLLILFVGSSMRNCPYGVWAARNFVDNLGPTVKLGDVMKTFFFAIGVAVISGMVCSVAADLPAEALQPNALRAAQQRGATELGCPAAKANVMSKKTIEETTTGWYEWPHRAEYTIGVSGCGKRVTYSVSCDNQRGGAECIVGGAAPSAAR